MAEDNDQRVVEQPEEITGRMKELISLIGEYGPIDQPQIDAPDFDWETGELIDPTLVEE